MDKKTKMHVDASWLPSNRELKLGEMGREERTDIEKFSKSIHIS